MESGLEGVDRPLSVRRLGIAGILKLESRSDSAPAELCLDTGDGLRTVKDTFAGTVDNDDEDMVVSNLCVPDSDFPINQTIRPRAEEHRITSVWQLGWTLGVLTERSGHDLKKGVRASLCFPLLTS